MLPLCYQLSRTLHLRNSMATVVQHPAKKVKASKTIGTHNGTFHCDEALAVFLLRQTSGFKDADVIRTRDPNLLETCSIVVDVGGIYSTSTHRYDHHQRGFEEIFGHGFVTKLSSAGLVYKHFGKEIIANRIGGPEDEKVETLWLKMYKAFVEAIDAVDNGISRYPAELKPKYIDSTSLSSRVSWLNPAWNQSVDAESVDEAFGRACKLTGEEFLNRLDYYATAWLPARDLVLAGLTERMNIDASGHIIVFDQYAPWKEHLFDLEKELSIPAKSLPIYVVYSDEVAGQYRVQAVPISSDSFESRKALPKAWCGLRDEALSTESGIEGGVFVHASGFIGGNKTKEGALAMAKKALKI